MFGRDLLIVVKMGYFLELELTQTARRRRVGSPVHQTAMDLTESAKDLMILGNADFKPGVQCQKAAREA